MPYTKGSGKRQRSNRSRRNLKSISILNDVLGVVRGPSNATAAAHRLGALARSLLGEEPAEAQIALDTEGPPWRMFREQAADRAFAAGLLGWPMTDSRFADALPQASQKGLKLRFKTERPPAADRQGVVRMELVGRAGRRLTAWGAPAGGGHVEIFMLGQWRVHIDGGAHEVLVEAAESSEAEVLQRLRADGRALGEPHVVHGRDGLLLGVRRTGPLPGPVAGSLAGRSDVHGLWQAAPLALVKRGSPMLADCAEMLRLCRKRSLSAGQIGARYEAEVLGITEAEVVAEVVHRFEIMFAAVEEGLRGRSRMLLLHSSADKIMAAESADRLPAGGMYTRAAARSMAAMHVNCSMGVVCAAPSAGASGVLPGVLATLLLEHHVSKREIADALLAAGLIGMILAQRCAFPLEAGCGAEIGAASAMAAAAVVEAAGGTPAQAADAAAVCLQNTIGAACDLVQGINEIPSHTRNALAAPAAFVTADLVLGGYENPIPLDETIDAVCSGTPGGLAATPSALGLKRLR